MAEARSVRIVTVWDADTSPPADAELVYCWNGYEEHGAVRSLLRYVEAHGERLRGRYVAWIHDLGEARVAGRRLIDHLALKNGMSYWWMTLLVEQSYWKSSPWIIDAIRMFALDEIIAEHQPAELTLVSAKLSLHQAIGGLCRQKGLSFHSRRPARRPRRPTLRDVYLALPLPLQASVSFARYLGARWRLRREGRADWFGGERSLFVCSYFSHLDKAACEQGEFRSGFWGGLPELLHKSGYSINWLHHYVPSNVATNAGIAGHLVSRFNEPRGQREFHAFLDVYLSWAIVLRVLRGWLTLMRIYVRLHGVHRAFQPQACSFSLWPILGRDWSASMLGPLAVENLLWIELFDRAMADIPRQGRGLYLCENQSWERALIHAWRQRGHGELIAVAHATVRFWDLRYFTDARTLRSQSAYPLPQPDLVALNGRMTVDDYISADHPRQAMVECEALRYGYLHDVRAARELKRGKHGAELRVLILGDYIAASTTGMLQLLEAALPAMSANVLYTLKPHPGHPVKAADHPGLKLRIVSEPLERILHEFDVAYASSVTSAAVDVYVAGMRVVVMLEKTELIMSPLRNRPGVYFVSTPEELAGALQESGSEAAATPGEDGFFFTDPQLPRWKRLLGLHG